MSAEVELGPERLGLLCNLAELRGRRVATIFRELRAGVTEDGRTAVKVPSGTLSTAEAISVVTGGVALSTHFGDGRLSAGDMAAA